MKAIVTKFHGATNTKGSRISASAEGGHRIYVSYDHGSDNPHRDAALTLASKLGWGQDWIEGVLPDGTTHCFVRSTETINKAAIETYKVAHKLCVEADRCNRNVMFVASDIENRIKALG